MFLVRRHSERLAHTQVLNQKYNYDPFEKTLKYAFVGHYDRLTNGADTSPRYERDTDQASN